MRRTHTCLFLLAFASPLGAQALKLDVRGGSYPGAISMQAGPGSLGRWASILISASRGPTPLKWADPNDPRVLSIGSESLHANWSGPFVKNGGTFKAVPLPVPNAAFLRDRAVYFQAVTWPGRPKLPTLIAKVSNPIAVRFGPIMSFCDRGAKLAKERVYHTTTPLAGRRVIAIGGSTRPMTFGITALKTTEIYDEYTDTWSAGPSMAGIRCVHTATALKDGRVLITGGLVNGPDAIDSCEIYDPKTNTISATAKLGKARALHSAVLLPGGKVMVFGGFEKFNLTNPLATLNSILDSSEIWDPATGKWTFGRWMISARAAVVIMPLPDGRIMVAGGAGWTKVFNVKIPTIWKTTEIYDPASGNWVAGPSMNVERGFFSHCPMPKDRFLLAGGANQITLSNPGTPTTTAEIFDAKTMTFKPIGVMAWGRCLNHTFPLGNDRYITVAGAMGAITAPSALNTTEIYDDKTGKWSMGPTLTAGRVWYEPFLNSTGQICFVSGGTGNNSTPVPSTEWLFR